MELVPSVTCLLYVGNQQTIQIRQMSDQYRAQYTFVVEADFGFQNDKSDKFK